MTAQSLYEECQDSIERGQELWKSYFTKWETIAKYEEDVPEDELLDGPIQRKKSTKNQSQLPKSKMVNYKKNRNSRRVIKKKNIIKKRKNEERVIRQHEDKDLTDDIKNTQLENVLKTVLTNILKANRNKIGIFAVMSQTLQNGGSSIVSHHHLSNFQLNSFSPCTTSRAICPPRSTLLGAPFGVWLPGNSRQTPFLHNRLKYNCSTIQQSLPLPTDMPGEINFGICNPENGKPKPLEWDFRHKSPDGICRKINREYFIKRSFPEMNITQDGKRFRSLCLRKRTNSVSLSMENSNFITPERKPSERKCFSENVLQGKRRRPSKVFFDNELEDSESDDQTENRAPIIHSKNKKLQPEIIPEGGQSDSDDCDSIFDWVKKA